MPNHLSDKNKLARTISWHKNAAFNCVVGFLSDELNAQSAKEINELYQEPGYKSILREFNRYYKLNVSSGEEFQLLMQKYSNPVDREAILGPVLRMRLGSLIKSQSEGIGSIDSTLESFFNNVKAFFNDAEDYSSDALLKANQAFLERLKIALITEPNERKTMDAFFLFHKADLEQYWRREGHARYADYLGDLNNSAEISEGELSILTESLEIGLQIYRDGSEEGSALTFGPLKNENRIIMIVKNGYYWMRVINHLEYVAEHNAPYSLLDDFLKNYIEKVRLEADTLTFASNAEQMSALDQLKEEVIRQSSIVAKAYADAHQQRFEFWQVGIPIDVALVPRIKDCIIKDFLEIVANQPKPEPTFTSLEFLQMVVDKSKTDAYLLKTLYDLIQSKEAKDLYEGKSLEVDKAKKFVFSIPALIQMTSNIEKTKERLLSAEQNSPGSMLIVARTVNERLQRLYENNQDLFQKVKTILPISATIKNKPDAHHPEPKGSRASR